MTLLRIDQLIERGLVPVSEIPYVLSSRDRLNYLISWLETRVDSATRVLEIGCGAAAVSLARMGASVVAWDKRTVMSEVCDELDIELRAVDLTNASSTWPQPCQSPDTLFDLVIFAEVIEHIPRPPHELLFDLGRQLKPGGLMVITTPNLYRLTNKLRFLRGRPIFAEFYADALEMGHFREYSLPELNQAVNRTNLTTVESKEVFWADGSRPLLSYLTKKIPFAKNYIWCVAKK